MPTTSHPFRPLHHALESGNNAIALSLIELSSPETLNTENDQGDTPLHVASWNKNPEIARKMMEKGASAEVPDFQGRTAIHILAEQNGAETLHSILPM